MKKVLLSTSAIALVGAVASPASANEWDMDVGGYMEWFAGYSDVEVDTIDDTEGYNGFGVFGPDSEIVFAPTLTLDNGIQFGANVQLGVTTEGSIDEAYAFAEGAFGQVLIGNENSAGYLRQLIAPDVTAIGVNSGSTTAFAPISGAAYGFTDGSATVDVRTGDDIFRGTLGATSLENMRNSDVARITYFTPRFAGFELGASYARADRGDNVFNQQTNTEILVPANFGDPQLTDIWDFSASYANSFGAFDVGLSGRYGFADLQGGHNVDEESPEVWGAGANLGYAGFTVGGSYAEQEDGAWMEGDAWDVGAAYETGPWGVSVTYFNGENVNNEAYFTDGADFADDEEELQQWIAGVSYIVAEGVVLGAYGGHIDFEEEVGDDGGDGDDVKSWFVGTSASLAF